MKSKDSIQITLRGQEVIVDLVLHAPERDVGLMGPWFEDEEVFSEDGEPLNWELSEKELQLIGEAAAEYYYSSDPWE